MSILGLESVHAVPYHQVVAHIAFCASNPDFVPTLGLSKASVSRGHFSSFSRDLANDGWFQVGLGADIDIRTKGVDEDRKSVV